MPRTCTVSAWDNPKFGRPTVSFMGPRKSGPEFRAYHVTKTSYKRLATLVCRMRVRVEPWVTALGWDAWVNPWP